MCYPCVTVHWHSFNYFSKENDQVADLLMWDDLGDKPGSRAHAWMVGLLCSALKGRNSP